MLTNSQRRLLEIQAEAQQANGYTDFAAATRQALADLDEALSRVAVLERREARSHNVSQSATADNGGTVIQSAGTVEAGAWMVGRMG
jgi:hypothetical protein